MWNCRVRIPEIRRKNIVDILTVSQINKYIAFRMKEDQKLKGIFVRGEISNFRASGHFYFTLKDNESLMKAVMFRSNAVNLKFKPENGMSVIAMGTVSVFERDGVYQLYVSDMIPDGKGDQKLEFDKLRKELEEEGLFDVSHKLPLPQFPQKIGVVTSANGAALQDVINVLSRRYPVAELCVYDSLVQGTAAPASLCSALGRAQRDSCDVVIMGRGGGSYEDLSAFNDRQLAYYIYGMKVPVISAVGHETDFTIADFVADMRAPTPSAAAELAAPDLEDVRNGIISLQARIKNAFELYVRRLDEKSAFLESRLTQLSPQNIILKNISETELKKERIEHLCLSYISNMEAMLGEKISRLEAMNPLDVLRRGYSVIYNDENKVIQRASELEINDTVKIRLADGFAYASVTKTEIDEKCLLKPE
jgi:exodeoxyribonuclease VII large subunit